MNLELLLHKEETQVKSLVSDIAVGVVASVLLGMTSSIAIYLPFSPIPISLTFSFMLFLSAILGPRRGLIMVVSYLSQGLMGYPVFTGGRATILTLLGPTGGYLLAYPFAAYTAGFLYNQFEEKSPLQLFKSMAIGNLIVYVGGFAWLSHLIGPTKALMYGILPFVIGDILKMMFFSRLSEYFSNRVKG